jgi:hypothetical protein
VPHSDTRAVSGRAQDIGQAIDSAKLADVDGIGLGVPHVLRCGSVVAGRFVGQGMGNMGDMGEGLNWVGRAGGDKETSRDEARMSKRAASDVREGSGDGGAGGADRADRANEAVGYRGSAHGSLLSATASQTHCDSADPRRIRTYLPAVLGRPLRYRLLLALLRRRRRVKPTCVCSSCLRCMRMNVGALRRPCSRRVRRPNRCLTTAADGRRRRIGRISRSGRGGQT